MSWVSERVDESLPTDGNGRTLLVYDYAHETGEPLVCTPQEAGDAIGLRAQEVFASWLRLKIEERQERADATTDSTDRTIQTIRIDTIKQLLVDLEA